MTVKSLRMPLLTLLALLLIGCPLWSLFVEGVFAWHIKQPAAWQGGIEAGLLWMVVSASLFYMKEWQRWTIIVLFCWIYSRRYGVDGAIILNYAYLQGLIAVGWIALPAVRFGRLGRLDAICISAFLGVVIWSILTWSAAYLGFGTLREIHWAALVILGSAYLISRPPQLVTLLARRAREQSALSAISFGLVVTMFFVMFAKSSVSTDFDSVWYGLAADRVLVASGTLLQSEGLVGPVHYYPKLFESLQLPLSGLGSITAVVGLSISGWLLLLLATSQSLRSLGIRRDLQAVVIALVATVPAFAGIAITAKGDTAGAWVLALSLLATIRYRQGYGAPWFWIALSAPIIAVLMRLSTIPYATVMYVVIACCAVARLRSNRCIETRSLLQSRGPWLVAAVLGLLVLVSLRTLMLAGVALIGPDFLVDLQAKLGLHVAFPVGRLQGGELALLPWKKALVAYLFDPREYAATSLQWTGNVWLYMVLAAVIVGARLRAALSVAWPFAAIGLLFFPVLLLNKYFPSEGADGNYFITPIIALIVFGAVLLHRSISGDRDLLAASGLRLVPFATASAMIFLVAASWGPGTRPFDANFSRPLGDLEVRSTKVYADYGMDGIARYLSSMPKQTKVIGDIDGAGFWLPIRYEPMMIVGATRRQDVSSTKRTVDFLQRDGIDYAILKHKDVAVDAEADLNGYSDAMLTSAITRMRPAGLAQLVYEDKHFDVWKLGSVNATGSE